MSVIGWIILGLIAGFVASKIVNRSGSGLVMDIIIGVFGALLGGFIFNWFGTAGISGFNLWSGFVAVVGAIILLVVANLFRRAV